MIRASIYLSAALFLSGCSFSPLATAWEEGTVEPNVDKAYDAALKRFCRLPFDVHLRAINRGTVTPKQLFDLCPEWQILKTGV